MITLNSAIGVLVFLMGTALVASIAVNLHTQHLLSRCLDVLGYLYEQLERERYEQEVSNHEGTD